MWLFFTILWFANVYKLPIWACGLEFDPWLVSVEKHRESLKWISAPREILV